MGYKEAIMALDGGVVCGDIIWQRHKQIPNLVEIKNLRISEWFRGRGAAAFMLKQIEALDTKRDFGIIGDVRAEQKEVIEFMKRMGFTSLFGASLYSSNHLEMVMLKILRGDDDNGFVNDIHKIFGREYNLTS